MRINFLSRRAKSVVGVGSEAKNGFTQCWAKSQEQCQPSGCMGTFAGHGGGMPELIPARLSYQQESSRLIFFQPASYIVF